MNPETDVVIAALAARIKRDRVIASDLRADGAEAEVIDQYIDLSINLAQALAEAIDALDGGFPLSSRHARRAILSYVDALDERHTSAHRMVPHVNALVATVQAAQAVWRAEVAISQEG